MTINKNNILVTGGAGNIGTNLCNELRSRGHNVIACDLYNTERDDYIRCDVRNYRQLDLIFDELGPFDFVIILQQNMVDGMVKITMKICGAQM